jgi:hypothetical protein
MPFHKPSNCWRSFFFAALLFSFSPAQSVLDREFAESQYHQKFRTFHTAEEFTAMTMGRVKLDRASSCRRCWRSSHNPESKDMIGVSGGILLKSRRDGASILGADVLPIPMITVILAKPGDGWWYGTPHGLIHYVPQDQDIRGTIEFLSGKRWLPDDQVLGIGYEETGSSPILWIETPKGFSRIEHKRMTLAEKSKAFVERIRARHVRWGMTADSVLKIPGDLSSNQMVSSDNDGLWTQMYIAAEVFRYKATGETDALANARQGLEAMFRLEEITGIPGFPARSIIKIGEDQQPADGEWHTTADRVWRWKGDTSSDEIVGHYFGYAVYYDLVADESEKRRIAGVVDRITGHILDHQYQLIDLDGKRTRWGFWGPDAIWEDADETGLRALHILSHLRVAYHITGKQRYHDEYQKLIRDHRYHLLTRNQKINIPGRINHSDDELAFLSYYPLLQYETDPGLKEVYIESLSRSWQIERPERNPLWNFIYAVGAVAKEFDQAESIRTLREIPMDQISWTVVNSLRSDIRVNSFTDRFKRDQLLSVLSYAELPMTKWNGNPYQMDGGNGGRNEGDGVYFLLPYWMGRYHKLINE